MDKKRLMRRIAGFSLLAVLCGVFLVLGLVCGSGNLTPGEVMEVLAGKSADTTAIRIVRDIRLPRVLAALILGGGLSVSGYLLQSFFGNPIAGPFVLGISSGAKLAVALAMIFSLQSGIMLRSAALVGASFAGSLVSTGLILLLSGKVRSMARLIIGGVMIGYICSAVTEIAVAFADDANIVNLHNWSMGSFSGINRQDIAIMTAVTAPACALAFLMSKPISAYQLGESYARNMGVSLKPFRAALILLSSLLSACVTAFAGPVSFVGVAVPHLMRTLFGTSAPIIIIPASFVGGGAFCMACDLLARSLFSPMELSISTVTALFGAPVVVWVMLRKQSERG